MQTMNDLGFTCHAATVAALVWKNLLMIYKQMGIAKSASTEILFTNLVWDVAYHSVPKSHFPGGTQRILPPGHGNSYCENNKIGKSCTLEKHIQRKLRADFPLHSSSQQRQNILYTVILQGTALERFFITSSQIGHGGT